MAQFLLVHGSWLGAWCWREVVPRLEARGHALIALDLPGHGEDRSPPQNVSFEDYAACVSGALNSSKDPCILLGHSMGGAIINHSADNLPGRLRALVYLTALIPDEGRSMISYVDGFDPEYLAQLLWAPDRRTATLQPEGVKRFLCSQCSAETIEVVSPLLKPEPVAPYETPILTTGPNLDKLPRYYIECLQDRIVPLALQRAMRSTVPIDGVYSLDTDHAPFFSTPEELAAVLHEIAQRV
jgi:pimeloyl-ACP methyl ester carboxylesterase